MGCYVKKKLLALLFSLATLVLTSCGGGNSGSTGSSSTQTLLYGSIYVNTFNGRGAITADYKSQAEADSAASDSCYTRTDGSKCERLLTFGTGRCGAAARGYNYNGATFQYDFVFSAESSSAVETARASALAGCIKAGGGSCEIVASACNGNGK